MAKLVALGFLVFVCFASEVKSKSKGVLTVESKGEFDWEIRDLDFEFYN